MKKLFLTILSFIFCFNLMAQNPTPAPANKGSILITGGIIHVGNGNVIENGFIRIEGNKIVSIGNMTNVRLMKADKMISASGKHIYPGLIAPNTNTGLSEIELVRSTNDVMEVGTLNPSVRSIIAYNTDSKIIPTLKANGVLMAQTVPQGGMVSGQSSVVQLDAWNWEDAVYKIDEGMHIRFPSMTIYKGAEKADDPNAGWKEQMNELRKLLNDTKAYVQGNRDETNLKLEAMKPVLNGSRKAYVHVHTAKEILGAIAFIKEFNLNAVLVEAEECYMVLDQIKQSNIPVILSSTHALPTRNDDDVQQPYKTPNQLQKAGILFCLSHKDWSGNQRNLAFQAGTAAAYGLTKEQALSTVTLNTAKILGIDKTCGSLEEGKDATLLICDGDVLDMKSNKIEKALIQGREISMDNIQKQLNEKYKKKYGVE
jgi:imidazolonepropionase-like amidohydrolase